MISRLDPPNGTLISIFEGENSTIICHLFNNSSQETTITHWNVLFYNNNSELQTIASTLAPFHYSLSGTDGKHEYSNILTLYDTPLFLNGSTIFCGTSTEKRLVRFPIRIHRKSTSPPLTHRYRQYDSGAS